LSWYYDTADSYSTIPSAWFLLGSYDGTTWSQVDYVSFGTSTPPISTSAKYPYLVKLQNVFKNTQSYQYYRVVFPSIFGGGTSLSYSQSYARLSEFD
jgi:hypothetical protein